MEYRMSAAILAGGASRRFGGITKPKIVIDGATIISRVVNTIADIFSELIIVTNTPSEFADYPQFRIVSDYFTEAGPLGGIHAALKSSPEKAVFIFAGDMPFLDRKIIIEQKDKFEEGGYDILIPRIGSLIEPLHAVWSVSVLGQLTGFLAERKERAIRDFLDCANTGYFQVEENRENRIAFTNINSPDDIEALGHSKEHQVS